MAFRDFARGLKNYFGPNNRFFNGPQEDIPADDYSPVQGAQPAPAYDADRTVPRQQAWPYPGAQAADIRQEQAYGPAYGQPQQYTQPQGYAQPQQYAQAQQYTQPQGYAQPQPYGQQPYASSRQSAPYNAPSGYQQPMQGAAAGYQRQTVDQPYTQPRARRSAQHARQRENVVPFPGTAPQEAQPQMPQQPQNVPSQGNAPARQIATCVINVRSIADCRSAIGILLSGDCVIAVMDSIADQNEVRRYVDTLNGACYSLKCTMTRTSSRVGVYFLAPAEMRVLTDQTTTQMNSQSRAPQRPRSGQTVFQSPWGAQRQQPAADYTAPQQGTADPRESFTQRPAPAYPLSPAQGFASRQPVQGFSPDRGYASPDEGYESPDQENTPYARDAL